MLRYIVLSLLLIACSTDTVCVPGTTAACICPVGTGAQSCLDDGAGYDTCRCVDYDGGAFDAGGDGGDVDASRDAATAADATVNADAGYDAGPDATIVDVDAGHDAGRSSSTCPDGYIHDVVASRCYTRSVLFMDGCIDPADRFLRWDTYEDQIRIEALLAGTTGGTDLVRDWFNGAWEWSDETVAPARIHWASGSPTAVRYSFWGSDGLRSQHVQPANYICMRDL